MVTNEQLNFLLTNTISSAFLACSEKKAFNDLILLDLDRGILSPIPPNCLH